MPLVPQYFHASTKQVAETALKEGRLKYPGICLIRDGSYFAWVTKNNKIEYVAGFNQITNIEYRDGLLCFMSGADVLYSADVAMTPETAERIKGEIVENLNLTSYAKSDDVVKLIDGRIGDLGDKKDVVEYVNGLSYNNLTDTPIMNLYGSLTKTVIISGLDDGVYRVSGQFKIGGNHQTVQMATDDSLFIVARNNIDNSTVITQLLGNFIKIFTIYSDGKCITDKYLTESYINQQDYITSTSVKEYVKTLVRDAIVETIDEVLDTRLDIALDKKISNIPEDDIISIFT